MRVGPRGLAPMGAFEIPQHVRQHSEGGLDQAQSLLALTATPPYLPCRDDERKAMTNFVEAVLSGGAPSNPQSTPVLFISSHQAELHLIPVSG